MTANSRAKIANMATKTRQNPQEIAKAAKMATVPTPPKGTANAGGGRTYDGQKRTNLSPATLGLVATLPRCGRPGQ